MLENRMSWLARPWFFAAVAVLALNDHVFKQAFPGWVTGKLSDVAGLVVVATILSVLLGPGGGGALAGVAFLALKTVPGVAEAVAPLMGGAPTLRDASDLLALIALPPLWLALRRDRPGRRPRTRRGWAMLGLVAAVLATAADSTSPPPRVTDVRYEGNAFHADVVFPSGDRVSFRSLDGGRAWQRTEEAPDGGPATVSDQPPEHCATDGTCYRLDWVQSTGQDVGSWQVIERHVGPGDWTEDYRFAEDARTAGVAVNPANGGEAVSAFDECVIHRTSGGSWESANLVDATERDAPVGATVVADTPRWQLDLMRTLNSSVTPITTLVLLSILIWWLVPWLSIRIILQVIAAVVGWVLSLFGGTPAVGSFLWTNAAWAGIMAGLVGLMRLTWWLERRSRPPAADPSPEDRR